MKSLVYKCTITMLIIFAVVHLIFAFIEFDSLTEQAAWFASAALALFFNAVLNIIHLRLCNTITYAWSLWCNISLSAFLGGLIVAVPEIQVIVLEANTILLTVFGYMKQPV